MEELLVFAVLLAAEIIETDVYEKKINAMFSACSETNAFHDILLHLEWESNINNAIAYICLHAEYAVLDDRLLGQLLMKQLKKYYDIQPNIKEFVSKLYLVWKNLPQHLQMKEPFCGLSYVDAPLSWGDEELSRKICKNIMDYYEVS